MKILVTRKIPAELLVPLESEHDIVMPGSTGAMDHEQFLEEMTDAGAVLSFLTDPLGIDVLNVTPRLSVVSQMAAGVDNIDVDACTARRIPVGHTPGVLTEATADTAFALLASSVRRIPEARDYARSGEWTEWRHDLLLGEDLHDTTLGIVGLGAIGSAVARRAAGFSMRILYTGRQRRPHLEATLRVSYRSLEELLAQSDHVVIAVPLTDTTRHMIGTDQLALMKPHASLVNISRGSVVETGALVDALTTGAIGRAALDVTDPEPLPADHPLLRLANCLVVPHIGSASRLARRRMMDLAVRNLIAGLQRRPMPACVNPAAIESARLRLDDEKHAAGQ